MPISAVHYNEGDLTEEGWKHIEKQKKIRDKLGLSCAKLSLASAKLHTSLSSDKLKLATN